MLVLSPTISGAAAAKKFVKETRLQTTVRRWPSTAKNLSGKALFHWLKVRIDVRFSNWAFGSSSFSLLHGIGIAHPGHASLRSLFDAA
jgi:hypothetical protein